MLDGSGDRLPSSDGRWIILAEDGRHVTIGRDTDPSESELSQAATMLTASGQGGWLAVSEGRYYSRNRMDLMMVRELSPTGNFSDEAVAAFKAIRRRARLLADEQRKLVRIPTVEFTLSTL